MRRTKSFWERLESTVIFSAELVKIWLRLLWPPSLISLVQIYEPWWPRVVFLLLYFPIIISFSILLLIPALISLIGLPMYTLHRICSRQHPTPPAPRFYPLEKYAVKSRLLKVRERSLTLISGTNVLSDDGSVNDEEKMEFIDDIGLEEGATKSKRETKDQKKMVIHKVIDQKGICRIWTLPPEIRAIIWMHAVGGGHVHIFRLKCRLGSIFCPVSSPTAPTHRDLCSARRDDYGFHTLTAWPSDRRPLSLLTSCRQVYSEAVVALYRTNTFAFDEAEICSIFMMNILPRRRSLIKSIHLAPTFNPDKVNSGYSKVNSALHKWKLSLETLCSMPNLKLSRITVTPTLNIWPSGPPDIPEIPHSFFASTFAAFAQTMNDYVEKRGCSITLAWCDPGYAQNGSKMRWEQPRYLPSPLRLSLRKFDYRPKTQLLVFFIPMHVRCLHCKMPTVIRRRIKGFAEVSVIERENTLSPSESTPSFHANHLGWVPTRKRYCLCHSACGGWIEFQYESIRGKWTVTAGAEEISEEQVSQHIEEYRGRYKPLNSLDEMVEGVEVMQEWDWESSDQSGTVMDEETWDRLVETTSTDMILEGDNRPGKGQASMAAFHCNPAKV